MLVHQRVSHPAIQPFGVSAVSPSRAGTATATRLVDVFEAHLQRQHFGRRQRAVGGRLGRRMIGTAVNHGKTMRKPWENHGKTMGKPWENGDLT